ncbi:winged helix DNA-binding domain-containing protein [Gaoshiqia sp. Z1-71]|uniref:winged helix DNA-binding domain-containing protein n=1 Tax=Gaoshiqia hydrogeniformans TaxID=3290090 RepID=UPI003BF8A0FC
MQTRMNSSSEIIKIRLQNQQIACSGFKTAKELVGFMGAMQAQDYAMVKWAVGIRLPDATIHSVEDSINHGELIRTHLLRPTWHLVSANDIHWILELTAPQIKSKMKSRHKELELNDAIIAKCCKIIENTLTEHQSLSREELIAELTRHQIKTSDNNRAAHILLSAELDGLICNGANNENKTTYSLLRKRVPKTKPFDRNEAIAALTEKYFLSHGPATTDDFIWWSGLPVKDARSGIEMLNNHLIPETIHSQRYWLHQSAAHFETTENLACLLPAYDEFIISYKDRSAILASPEQGKVISSNGLFKPVILVNGQVAGLWKRTIKKNKAIIETELFRPLRSGERELVEQSARLFARFIAKEAEIRFN